MYEIPEVLVPKFQNKKVCLKRVATTVSGTIAVLCTFLNAHVSVLSAHNEPVWSTLGVRREELSTVALPASLNARSVAPPHALCVLAPELSVRLFS